MKEGALQIDGALRRKVNRLLDSGADAEKIAAVLVKRGWDPDVALATAEREDRDYQDHLRERNMGKTHVSRRAVQTGGTALGGLALVYFALKAVSVLLRALDDD